MKGRSGRNGRRRVRLDRVKFFVWISEHHASLCLWFGCWCHLLKWAEVMRNQNPFLTGWLVHSGCTEDVTKQVAKESPDTWLGHSPEHPTSIAGWPLSFLQAPAAIHSRVNLRFQQGTLANISSAFTNSAGLLKSLDNCHFTRKRTKVKFILQ